MTPPSLEKLTTDVASAIQAVDADRPVWTSVRTERAYLPGIGPMPEAEATKLIAERLARDDTGYSDYSLGCPYPNAPRQRCDWVLEPTKLAIEVKLLRLLGDNGKPNDNMLMHILSPYPVHRSALTDVQKLLLSGFQCPLVILIYGFEYSDWPLDPAIDAFERLAKRSAELSARAEAPFDGLVHPVHDRGRVFAWLCHVSGNK